MSIEAPFSRYEEVVRPAWIDYSGHMNVGNYLLAFENAARCFFAHIDLSERYRERTNHALFASETYIAFEREVRGGDRLRFASQILGASDKAVDCMHFMYHAGEGYLAAANQVMYLHVDLARRRVAALPPDALARLRAVAQAHAKLPRPPQAGRAIGLRAG